MKLLKPKAAAGPPNALDPPPIEKHETDAAELMRAWIVKGTLRIAMAPILESPDTWGLLLVDIARHASRMFEDEGVCLEAHAMERIRALWNAEVSHPTDLGVTDRAQ